MYSLWLIPFRKTEAAVAEYDGFEKFSSLWWRSKSITKELTVKWIVWSKSFKIFWVPSLWILNCNVLNFCVWMLKCKVLNFCFTKYKLFISSFVRNLTSIRLMLPIYRNQKTDLQCNSVYWFLYIFNWSAQKWLFVESFCVTNL